jgi:hypothetical protein
LRISRDIGVQTVENTTIASEVSRNQPSGTPASTTIFHPLLERPASTHSSVTMATSIANPTEEQTLLRALYSVLSSTTGAPSLTRTLKNLVVDKPQDELGGCAPTQDSVDIDTDAAQLEDLRGLLRRILEATVIEKSRYVVFTVYITFPPLIKDITTASSSSLQPGARGSSAQPASLPSNTYPPAKVRATEPKNNNVTSTEGTEVVRTPITRRRPFAANKGETIWHYTASEGQIPHPPVINVNRGEVYVHKNLTDGTFQFWLYGQNDCWEVVESSDKIPHPLLPGRVLSLRANGEPGWITTRSYLTLRARKLKNREQAAGQ